MSLIDMFSFGLIKPKNVTTPHEALRIRFDIPNSYASARPLPTLLMYHEFGISYKSTREDVVCAAGAQSLSDEWYRDIFPARFERTHPAINLREGILATKPSGPQIMYNYYQSEFSGPKLGVMIVDSTYAQISHFKDSEYKVAKPVRFAMFAKQDLDNPMGGDLTISKIYVDGKKIRLSQQQADTALDYAECLFKQIKVNNYNPASAYQSVYGGINEVAPRLET